MCSTYLCNIYRRLLRGLFNVTTVVWHDYSARGVAFRLRLLGCLLLVPSLSAELFVNPASSIQGSSAFEEVDSITTCSGILNLILYIRDPSVHV